MDPKESIQSVRVILDGTNYVSWSNALSRFIKGRRLWRVITGVHTPPIKTEGENDESFDDRLDEWEGKNYQIVTWLRATTISSISQQFARFQDDAQYPSPAKAIWDFLKERYQTTSHAHQYQLL